MRSLLLLILITYTSCFFAQAVEMQNLSVSLPKGYVIFEKIEGDLNKDGVEDFVLIIKGTDKTKIIDELDRNRRGIIVLLKKKEQYELVLKNTDCFSSENEEGGVYFAPELSVEINKGNLYVGFKHGRYGYWTYTFRLNKSDFELIGYDASENRGPVVIKFTSLNFLSKKKQIKVNVNENVEAADEKFIETWENIKVDRVLRLSEIKDFDELDIWK